MYRIIERISDTLPIVGGGVGAVTQVTEISPCMITFEMVISTIVVAIIGSVVGYIVKLGLNAIMKKIKKIRNE